MSELLDIAARIADAAKPGEQVEAYVARGVETSVRVYEGEVEHLTSAQSEGIGIRVIRDGRVGFSYAGTLDDESVAEALADARDNSSFGTPDEFAALAEPDGVVAPKLALWRDELEGFSTERKVALAKDLEQLALAGDPRVRVDDANFADVLGEEAVATSTGIRASARATGCYVAVSTLADEDGETQTGWGYSVGRAPSDLDLSVAAGDAVRRATEALGAKKPASRKVTVVLDPIVTASFLGIVGNTLNAESVLKGRSLFANRIGELVASPLITFVDDATNPLAYTATEVDGEGLAARRTSLIEAGVLQGFVHSSYSARRMGAHSTGNAVRGGFKGTPGCGCLAVALTPGTATQDELIAAVGDGVLIRMVQGLHSGVNPVSGDFSTGASGRVIRNGQLAEPIREFTIASTLQRMLLDIQAVGGDVQWLPSTAAGLSLVITDVTMSGA
jgi:PmbA protein